MPAPRHILAAALATGALVLAAAPPAVARPAAPRVLAAGLDNPRGLSFGPDGTLYVAEAGRGGAGPCRAGEEGETCFGLSGAITRIAGGHAHRIASGLPSQATAGGVNAVGPSDVSADRSGHVWYTVGLGGSPDVRTELPELAGLARLYTLTRRGPVAVADLGAYEKAVNPDGAQPPDTNPIAVLATGNARLAVDAGGNSLVRVAANGRISTVATFPQRVVASPPGIPGLPPELPMQAVPTSVVRGPDGAYYVGELTGFPFPAGQARVWRVAPGQPPTVYAQGLTAVIDLAFGPDGRLYVLELAKNGLLSGDPAGALLRLDRDGTPHEIRPGLLTNPGGLVIRGSDAYVSNCSTCAGTGTVLRIPLS